MLIPPHVVNQSVQLATRTVWKSQDCWAVRQGGAAGLPWWAVALIVLGACAVFTVCVVGANLIVRTYQRRILGATPFWATQSAMSPSCCAFHALGGAFGHRACAR